MSLALLNVNSLIENSIFVDTFTGGNAKGNRHQVYYIDDDCHIDEFASVMLAMDNVCSGKHIHVFIFYRAGQYYLRFMHYHQEVSFCGSGILAAAEFLYHKKAHLKTALSYSFSLRHIVVTTNIIGRRLYFSLQSTFSEHIFFHKKITTWVGKTIKNACLVGRQSDYLLLELADDSAVSSARPLIKKLCRPGGPVLILTAKAKKTSVEDYVMRYFAPQYGNDEDSATGSANIYLMHYWHKRLYQHQVIGRQMSKAGGVFFGVVKNNTIYLGGRCEIKNFSTGCF